MDREEIKRLFMNGIDCSQVVTGHFATACKTDKDTMWRISSCFGGGMQCGETCGAVTGALMVIGMTYGYDKEGDVEQKGKMLDKLAEFKQEFAKKYASCICRDLLGYNVADPEELKRVLDEGLLLEFCPVVVEDTIEILETIL